MNGILSTGRGFFACVRGESQDTKMHGTVHYVKYSRYSVLSRIFNRQNDIPRVFQFLNCMNYGNV